MKKKKTGVKGLKKKVWDMFSKYIRARDAWTCFTCGVYIQGRNMHAGHFISRTHNSTLFDEMNVHAQCASCNMYRNGQPHIYADKIIEIYGFDAFKSLIRKGTEVKQFSTDELNEMYNKYADLVKKGR